MLKMGTTPVTLAGIKKAYAGTEQVYGLPSAYREITGVIMDGGTYYEIDGFRLKGSDT